MAILAFYNFCVALSVKHTYHYSGNFSSCCL